ncbi:uncharacterized protein PHACADRAFT_88878 [Phanerochaete carnosa HHB-10118-sp]|uniref:Carbohydrate-binding module family 13 protein n=1 Tax=Phanerochaete carnosa (strain HHB-10118-sp) TaxID=650164 RepID=K5X439_PHACS|nr:uncharacterized protein PHACADRAFT_88878 [Phanerochaete carnosa HHB-10118-sp]EKM57602.1 hypothetical protein PHACADRAFT_88878 [Phanerochaete carnosa HHB-10118-sp]
MFAIVSFAFALLSLPLAHAQTYSATYAPSSLPDQTEEGQSGTNKCGTTNHQDSMCQNIYINSVDDFCFYASPQPGANSTIGDTERIEVSWCLKDGYGTRTIPPNTISGAHFVQTPDYVQVTGTGNLTQVNIPAGDAGGELDPHGADGNGNPIGGLVFSNAFTGQYVQVHEWTNYMSDTQFCFRACKDGPDAPALCQHIYDEMGCAWNMPANYDSGTFERCGGDSGEPMGVYGTSTFHQGDPSTPSPHSAPSSSACTTVPSVGLASMSGSSAPTSAGASSASATSKATSGSTGSAPSATSGSHTSSTSELASMNWVLQGFAIVMTVLGGIWVVV